MAGYSSTPLAKKLGIKAGHRLALVDAPDDFEFLLVDLPDTTIVRRTLRGKQPFDTMVFFIRSEEELARRFLPLSRRLATAGGLWIAWPKKASGVPTDLTENVVRRIGLAAGLVDNKVCAIDATWSGLRFVRRLADRE